MKILLPLSLLLCSCSMLSGVQTRRPAPIQQDVPMRARDMNDSPKKRILVLPFLDEQTSRSANVLDQARKSVVAILTQTGQFLVVSNDDFPQGVERFKNQQNYNLEAIAKIAANLGVAAVVEGVIQEVKVKRLSDQVGVFRKVKAQVDGAIRMRVVATKTGREVLNDVRTAQVVSETTKVGEYQTSDRFLEEDPFLIHQVIEKALRGSVSQISLALEKLSWEGRIALVKGERIYLNAGRLSGLQVGDILKVMEEGEEVFDPETGALIGRVPGRMKGTVEIVSYFGKDGAIGIVHSGSGFQENDRVELY